MCDPRLAEDGDRRCLEVCGYGHPEIKWVWKPHPSLRWRLELTVKSWKEMRDILDRVVLRGDDFRKQERHSAVRRANLSGNLAGRNIVNILSRMVES